MGGDGGEATFEDGLPRFFARKHSKFQGGVAELPQLPGGSKAFKSRDDHGLGKTKRLKASKKRP